MDTNRRDRSRRGELNRLLGALGDVLPRQETGTFERPAAGWYAVMAGDGRLEFLGHSELIAAVKIRELGGGVAA